MQRPAPGDYAPHFQSYVERVPDGDVLVHLERQGRATCTLLAGLGEAKGSYAYAAGKWSVKRLMQHVVDGERLFCYRALCIARGEQASLPGFDEDLYAANDGSDGRFLTDIAAELASVRVATILLFRGFDGAAWTRRGTANGKPATVRSLPWILAGHELHHLAVLREEGLVATRRDGQTIWYSITDPAALRQAMDQVVARFGGLDLVVSNAGAAWSGAMASLPDADLRASFELNLFAHQAVAQAAMAVFRAQDSGDSGQAASRPVLGGQLLFNVSKQALNPGPNFGAYGIAKAALLALMRQYALEGGAKGLRANGLNADRIRSGLLDDAMIRERSAARGLTQAAYMGGNLLGQEVRASDVADAFVALARMERTTGALLTVDGGNVAAMVR